MIGIDFSMTSPAVVIGTCSDPEQLEMLCFKNRTKDSSLVKNIKYLELSSAAPEERRYYEIAYNIISFIKRKTDSKEVWLEGYSFGSTGSVFNIAEATATLKHLLWMDGYSINIISPKSIKKFASGSGNTDKNGMYDTFLAKTGYDFNDKVLGQTKHLRNGYKSVPSPVSDIIDAYFILQYGLSKR